MTTRTANISDSFFNGLDIQTNLVRAAQITLFGGIALTTFRVPVYVTLPIVFASQVFCVATALISFHQEKPETNSNYNLLVILNILDIFKSRVL